MWVNIAIPALGWSRTFLIDSFHVLLSISAYSAFLQTKNTAEYLRDDIAQEFTVFTKFEIFSFDDNGFFIQPMYP